MVFFVAANTHCALRSGGLSCYYSTVHGAAYGQVLEKKACTRIDFVQENQ